MSRKDPSSTPPKSTPMQHALASQGAAVIATVTFYPFDVVRMRFMSQDGTSERLSNKRYYTSTFGSMKVIASEEGARTLFRGAHVSATGVIVSWGVYMWLYRHLQQLLEVDWAPHIAVASLSSVTASVSAAVIANPIWMAKTRMQLEAVRDGPRHYRSFFGSIKHTIETTGFRSLWRGVSAQVLLSVPNAFTLPLYDWMKARRLESKGHAQLAHWEVASCSVMSKTTIAIASHPIVLVKTRLMDQRSREGEVQYKNLVGTICTTIKREGPKGMFRGLVPGLCQSIPRNLLHFLLYEHFLAKRV